MIKTKLPPRSVMLRALMNKDADFDGLFVAGIKTTGIFCRPGCPARKPKPENVTFFASTGDALIHGYRACKRCRPLDGNADRPPWLEPLLRAVDERLDERWRDRNLRALGIDPVAARRWFQRQHGMTFHAYVRARKLGSAMKQVQTGKDTLRTGLDHGYISESGFRDAFAAFFETTPGRVQHPTDTTESLIKVTHIATPLGVMIAGIVDSKVCLLEFGDRRMLKAQCLRVERLFNARLVPGRDALFRTLKEELQAYFAGALRRFSVPLGRRGTPFQERVWDQLLTIPYGRTLSYKEMAEAVGIPGGQRAVGKANGDNRIGIIIPCHRVIRSDGVLSGYGGGVWRKQALLDHEREGSVTD